MNGNRLPEHARHHFRRRLERSRACVRGARGAAAHAERGRAARCAAAGVREQAGSAQRDERGGDHGQARPPRAPTADVVHPGRVRDERGWSLRGSRMGQSSLLIAFDPLAASNLLTVSASLFFFFLYSPPAAERKHQATSVISYTKLQQPVPSVVTYDESLTYPYRCSPLLYVKRRATPCPLRHTYLFPPLPTYLPRTHYSSLPLSSSVCFLLVCSRMESGILHSLMH